MQILRERRITHRYAYHGTSYHVTSYLFQSIEEFNRAGGRSESHSTIPCGFLRLLLPCSIFFRAPFFPILAAGYETTRCSLRVSCNFDERHTRERSLLYSLFFVAAQWVDDFSFLLSHHDLLLLSLVHSRRIKLQPFPQRSNDASRLLSLSLRELF